MINMTDRLIHTAGSRKKRNHGRVGFGGLLIYIENKKVNQCNTVSYMLKCC